MGVVVTDGRLFRVLVVVVVAAVDEADVFLGVVVIDVSAAAAAAAAPLPRLLRMFEFERGVDIVELLLSEAVSIFDASSFGFKINSN